MVVVISVCSCGNGRLWYGWRVVVRVFSSGDKCVVWVRRDVAGMTVTTSLDREGGRWV